MRYERTHEARTSSVLLRGAVDTFEQDDEIGCIVITGTDRAFAAGADIKEMLSKEFLDAYFEDFGGRNWQRLVDCRKPIIAAVAGYALGGGCELALMCDIVIAGEDAKFGLPEITLGMMPAWAARSGCRAPSARPRRWRCA